MTLSTARIIRSDPALGFVLVAVLHVQRAAFLVLAGLLSFTLWVCGEVRT